MNSTLKAEPVGFAGSLDMKLQRKRGCEKVKCDMWVPGLGNRKDGVDGVTLYENGSGNPRSRFWGDEDIRSLVFNKFENLLDIQEEISNTRYKNTRIWNSGREVQALDKM